MERLDRLNCPLPPVEERYYDYRAAYDFESVPTPFISKKFERFPPPEELLPFMPLDDEFRETLTAENLSQLRRDYPKPLFQLFGRDHEKLLTSWRSNGHITIRIPVKIIPENEAGANAVQHLVRVYTQTILYGEERSYILESVRLRWADLTDSTNAKLMTQSILLVPTRVVTVEDAKLALSRIVLTNIPAHSRLMALDYRINRLHLSYLERLTAMSWSVRSNIPGDTDGEHTLPHHQVIPSDTVDQDMSKAVDKLLVDFYDYLTILASKAKTLMSNKFQDTLAYLHPKYQEFSKAKTSVKDLKEKLARKDHETDEIRHQMELDMRQLIMEMAKLQDYSTLYQELDSWLGILPVCGFNSGTILSLFNCPNNEYFLIDINFLQLNLILT